MNETGNNQKYNIICLSNQQWDYPLPTNKYHVMSRLAERGHNVLFVDPPINTGRLFARQVLMGRWGIGRLLTRTYKDKTGATIFSPLKITPDSKLTSKWHVSKINSLAQKNFNPSLKTILWVYHVEIQELKYFIENVNHDILIYDCVDNYGAFPENSLIYSATAPKKMILDQEEMITKKADLVFATAPGLVDKLKKFRDTVHFTPNVANFEKFSKVQELKQQEKIDEDVAKIKRPRIGFTGAVDEYKFDKELVKKIAKDHPNFNFVIIGPLALKDKEATSESLGFSEFKNVHFLGSKPYETLEYSFAGFDAYIIPFQLNDYTVGGCFPVKFHEALGSGLPTIVTDMPAYYPFSEVCYIAKNYDEFSQMIERGLKEDTPEKIKARIKVASENSWEGKTDQLLNHINSLKK